MLLSVVVTIVDGGDALARCLQALVTQRDGSPLEIVVPYDDTVEKIAEFVVRFPDARFLNLGHIATASPSAGAAGQHELFDRRRAAGLAAARGDLMAILEDRGVPRAEWAREVRRLHAERPDAVIGGAIENACDQPLNWAVYFCDFGRYQRPFSAGARAFVSDVNVSYKRAAIEQTRPLWQNRYHEPVVHDALTNAGETLILTPELVVDQIRGPLQLTRLLRERVAWGRLFASLRVREAGVGTRGLLAAVSALLPVVLFVRLLRMQLEKRLSLRPFVMAAPATVLLLSAWSLGEFLGYVTGTSAARAK